MPKLTLDDINRVVAHAEFHVFANKTTVVCLTTKNGFQVIGYSSCVDPKDYDVAIGNKIAVEDAIRQLWKLEGYLQTFLDVQGFQDAVESAAHRMLAAETEAEAQAKAEAAATPDAKSIDNWTAAVVATTEASLDPQA
jgi:RPA family protein